MIYVSLHSKNNVRITPNLGPDYQVLIPKSIVLDFINQVILKSLVKIDCITGKVINAIDSETSLILLRRSNS